MEHVVVARVEVHMFGTPEQVVESVRHHLESSARLNFRKSRVISVTRHYGPTTPMRRDARVEG